MEVTLIHANGEDAGKETSLHGSKFFIGRAEDCHLRLQDDSVARHHCVVLLEDDFMAIRDMGSKSGTFVNGDRAACEHPLQDGDRLRLGDREFDVRVASRGAEEEPELAHPSQAAAAGGDSGAGDKTDRHVVDDDMDLDHWLDEAPDAEAPEQPAPDAPHEKQAKRAKKDESVEVVGVWKNGNWKPTSVDPSQAAAETLKDLFRRH